MVCNPGAFYRDRMGAFYRDRMGDVWQAQSSNALLFVAFSTDDETVQPMDLQLAVTVEDEYGPLTEVRPRGWESI